MSHEGNAESSPVGRVLKRRSVRALLGAVLLGTALLLALPHGFKWGIVRWFTGHGVDRARVTDVDFNPFTGRMVVKGLAVEVRRPPG